MKFQWVGFILPLIGWLGSRAHHHCRVAERFPWIEHCRPRCSMVAALPPRVGRRPLAISLMGHTTPKSDEGGLRSCLTHWVRDCPLDAKWRWGMAAALVLGLVVIAVVTRTTNWDSLTYHLPRVIHCMQQGSVDHLGTNNMRQIEFGPWSEYAILNLHLLSGGDSYANLVHWFAMTGSVAVGSFMAQRLGDAPLAAVPGATGGATRRSRNSHRIAAL